MPGALPLVRTSSVGRSDDLARVQRLVGRAAVVTLTGAGGWARPSASPRGRASCPAGSRRRVVRGPVADALTRPSGGRGRRRGSGHARGGRPVVLIAGQVGDRRVLLVLDTFEHP